MNLVCVGISHHTAPLEHRERLWYSDEETRAALHALRAEGFGECVLVSTCNRTELYAIGEGRDLRVEFLKHFLLTRKGASEAVATTHLFAYFASGAAEHLFRVASGIDSMVIGDVQILAQIKQGLTLATEAGTAGFFMNKLFQSAFHVGKRARSETHISEGAVSISYAAVELAQRIFDDLSRKCALVIGAGETAQLTAKHLVAKGIGTLLITNRTGDRSERLARMVGGHAVPFESFRERLSAVDIIISSVQGDRYVLTAAEVARVNKERREGALFLIDIGVPRNIDPAARELENVFLYDIDGLNVMVKENIEKRLSEVPRIETIIAEELTEFYRWHTSLQANPTIAALTELVEQIRKEEVEKNINRFEVRDRELLELVTKRIVNKLLHTPIINLKNGAGQTPSERLEKISLVRRLFGLDVDRKE